MLVISSSMRMLNGIQRTTSDLRPALGQSQQSRTEAKTRADSLSVNTLKPPSEFGTDTVVGRIPGRLAGESLDRLGSLVFRLGPQVQEQHVRPDKDQLTTDTADLKVTKDALAEDAAALEDQTQDRQACQTKVGFRGLHQQESD